MKEEVCRLWKACFDDPEEFVSFYFDKVYRLQNTRVVREGGKLVSALQMLPYPMTWLGTEVSAWYISGASTLPEHRGKGIMQKLLVESFEEMHDRNGMFSILIPQEEWLYAYYARLGYAPVFACTLQSYTFPSVVPSLSVEIPGLPECLREASALYGFFNREMRKRPNCVQHTAVDFEWILEDLYLSKGCLFVFREPDGTPGGMAFARPGREATEVPEILYRTAAIQNELLARIGSYWPGRQMECCLPPADRTASKRGMARILDAPGALGVFAATHPEADFRLELRDPLLPGNNGFFRIRNGQCFRIEESREKNDFRMEIGELAAFLFPHPAHISLMLE
ncbi:MAG: GNAT family N-acetyltransferase [Culturomica sp.]|jgi:predicted acetyltransferase|nr:GNAT family N-acetyltransferase [Culturomica sp.]